VRLETRMLPVRVTERLKYGIGSKYRLELGGLSMTTYPQSPNWPIKERHWEVAVAGLVVMIAGVALMFVTVPTNPVGSQHPYGLPGWLIWLAGMTMIDIGVLWPKPGAVYT